MFAQLLNKVHWTQWNRFVHKVCKIEELPDLNPNNNENSIGPVHGTGLQGGSHTYVSGQLEYCTTTSGFMER